MRKSNYLILHNLYAVRCQTWASDLKRMKEMEAEMSRLKRMYADLALENRALKDLIEKKL
jgi:hypothetical protein